MRRAVATGLLAGALVVLCGAATATAQAVSDSTFHFAQPPPPDAEDDAKEVLWLRLVGLEGSFVADSAARAQFVLGFRSALAQPALEIERRPPGGSWKFAGASIPNQFRFRQGGAEDTTFRVQAVVDSAARPARTEVGFTVRLKARLLLWTPEAVAAGARVMPLEVDLRFSSLSNDREVIRRDAGRVMALRAIEELLRWRDELPDGRRLRWVGRP